MTNPKGLTRVSLGELEALRDRIDGGAIAVPLTSAGLHSVGLRDKPWLAEHIGGLDRDMALRVLNLVIAERVHGARTRLDLVWTGPEATASTSRDTWVVMHEMFASAKERVLIAGYAFDSGKDLFKPLHRSMIDRGVEVQMFLNIGRASDDVVPQSHARKAVQDFLIGNWPGHQPYPRFYYDPRTVEPNSTASLHAKCVVVDERRTLIGSANFTDRGQTRNVEIGVLIDEAAFAREVVLQWQGLVNQGFVEQCVP
jgi:phosphatidylserine/phosphatidylglycerophosphate/cardiolipin synthase-like enzyme